MHDIDEIRRRAMELLEKEAGGPVAAATRAGMTYTQWANLRSGAADSKTGKPRGMRKETARKIELAFGKDTGWLDAADLESRRWRDGGTPMMSWQPIDTAPKDGTYVLLFIPQFGRCHIWRGNYIVSETFTHGTLDYRFEGWNIDIVYGDRPEPTHWMPLPAGPEV
jgi:hypothetical protein